MLTWQGLEKTCIGIYFSDQIWMIKIEYLGWSTLKSNYYQTSIDFVFFFFFHMVQYVAYYNFHVYKFGFYSHKNMLWLFEWKQSPRVLGFVGQCRSSSKITWKMNLIPVLNKKLTTGSYGVGIGRAWCSKKACEICGLLV
jgi:hypothetical protein